MERSRQIRRGYRKDYDMKKGKRHFSLKERCLIEAWLHEGKSIRAMARELSRDRTTVEREIRNRAVESLKGTQWTPNQCARRADCAVTGLCADKAGCSRRCSRCQARKCNERCPQFEPVECPDRPRRPGRVCNGCPRLGKCHLVKRLYIAEKAHADYRKTLVESREGIDMEEAELSRLDKLVSPKILAGQSLHHIFASNPGRFTVDERTVYRHVNDGLLSAKRGDMKRSCRVKPRKSRKKEREHKVEKGCRGGRTYDDYLKFVADNPGVHTVMMDLVIGRVGGKCILTLHFPEAAFMAAYLIDDKCAESVGKVFRWLWEKLGPELFRKLFPLVLTDNGTEFSNPSAIELAPDETRRSAVFFCDPMNSNQKSQLERNHELLREILPKGTSFDGLTQEQVSLAISHVNAYVRNVKADKTPYDLFAFLYGEDAAEKLGVTRVDPRDVVLKPSLVGIRYPTLIERISKMNG